MFRKPAVKHDPKVSDRLDLALAEAAGKEALWAVHKLIDNSEAIANENAADDMHDSTVMAGYVGGAQHLRALRDELNSRRENGLRLLGVIRKIEAVESDRS